MKAEVTCLQATMATADELYSEYIPDVDMKKFDNDQQAANTIVNLTSELVDARTLTTTQVRNLVRVLKRNETKVNFAVKTLKQQMKKSCNGEGRSSAGQYQEKDNLSVK